jgi:hypothetical protein
MIKVTRSVWQSWRKPETEKDIALLVKTNLAPDAAFDRVAAACAQTDLDDAEGDSLAELHPAPVEAGVAIWVGNCDDLEPVLDRLIGSLNGAGLDGATITTLPVAEIGIPLAGVAFIKAQWVVRANPVKIPHPVYPDRPGIISGWHIERFDLDSAVDYLLDWAYDLPGLRDPVYLSTGAPFTAAPRAVARSLIKGAVRGERPANPIVVSRAGITFRVVYLGSDSAYATAAAGVTAQAEFVWRDAVSVMTDLLVRAPDWARSGYLNRGGGWGSSHGNSMIHPREWQMPPGVPAPPVQRRAVEADHLIDALGTFMRRDPPSLMGLDRHLWIVDQLAGTTLVRHRDLEAWYGDKTVRPDVRQPARASLDGLLPESA